MTNEPTSSFADINDVRLHVLDWGGEGEPILIIHATGFLGRIYKPIAERLRTIGHVYSYDQRGHGDSSLAPDGNYSWDLAMRDLEALIMLKGWKNIRAVGHSMGGTIIGGLAAIRPDLISKGVLIDPVIFELPIGPDYTGPNLMRDRALKRRRIFDSVDVMFADYKEKAQFKAWDPHVLHDYCEFGTKPNSDGTRELKCAPEIEARIYETGLLFNGLSYILRSKSPLLVMLAERSRFAKLSAKLRAEMKHGEVINVSGASHLVAMEEPELVSKATIEFFT